MLKKITESKHWVHVPKSGAALKTKCFRYEETYRIHVQSFSQTGTKKSTNTKRKSSGKAKLLNSLDQLENFTVNMWDFEPKIISSGLFRIFLRESMLELNHPPSLLSLLDCLINSAILISPV